MDARKQNGRECQAGHGRSVAVFDFDKTLINTDVAYHFLNTAIRRSKVRRMAVGLLMPILLPFLLTRRSRSVAMSTMMWIATFPLRGRTSRDVFGAFAAGVFAPPIKARFYHEGLDALAAHRRLGHRLLIISGSPQELVEQVVRSVLDRDIEVYGSQVVPFLGGLIYRRLLHGIRQNQAGKKAWPTARILGLRLFGQRNGRPAAGPLPPPVSGQSRENSDPAGEDRPSAIASPF